MAGVRLQKYLSQCGVASRRKAEELIRAGAVKVNGRVITELGSRIDPERDEVQAGKRAVKPRPKGVILLNKPVGVVSTLSDPQGRRTIADYISTHYRSYFPVGRLDYDSCGLMVLTNDGELAEVLLHPRYGFERVYEVVVKGRVADRVLWRIERGVRLEDGLVRARVNLICRNEETSTLRVAIKEGRNRIVRRLMERLAYPVQHLMRLSHGPFRLGSLKPGQIRRLSEREYRRFKARISAAAAA